MKVELQINNSASAGFVAWAPSPCRIRVTDPSGVIRLAVNLRISAKSVAGGGSVGFRKNPTGAFASSLTLPVLVGSAGDLPGHCLAHQPPDAPGAHGARTRCGAGVRA